MRRVRVLHEATDFAYEGTATTATNLLGQATVYRHGVSGITESITVRTEAITVVAFDGNYRPVTVVTRDSAAVASISYDEDGRIASLLQTMGETTFTNSSRGVRVASGAWTARYRYPDRKIVHARWLSENSKFTIFQKLIHYISNT